MGPLGLPVHLQEKDTVHQATALHGAAIQDIILSDSIQTYFEQITLEETDLIDKIIRYGRLKGWIPLVPSIEIPSS